MKSFIQAPVFGMAFRPFYLLAALYGILSILLWGWSYFGNTALPGMFWHAHEMIWGYSGAIIVGFLLTAVTNWTGQAPVHFGRLLGLVLLWLAARVAAFLSEAMLWSGILGTLFFLVAAFFMAQAIFATKNSRNYIAIVALLLFAASHAYFHFALQNAPEHLQSILSAGLLIIAAFIGLIGGRVIPFFTSKRLQIPPVSTPLPVLLLALLLPLLMAINLMLQLAVELNLILGSIAGGLGVVQSFRWLTREVLREPMLWTLHLGYLLTSLGLMVMAVSVLQPQFLSLGVHSVAVGGIGLLTVSMMARTALGHTGRALYPAPPWIKTAFYLMILAFVVRVMAAVWLLFGQGVAYDHSIKLSSLCFAVSLALYFWRYCPWLLAVRIDGKAG